VFLQAEARGDTLDGDVVRPKIPFAALLEKFAAVEVVDDFYSVAGIS
jgi:hypothetical protein